MLKHYREKYLQTDFNVVVTDLRSGGKMDQQKEVNENMQDHIDFKIGGEQQTMHANSTDRSYFESEMLMMQKKQTRYLESIRNMLTYFVFFSIFFLIFIFYLLMR